MPGKIYAVKKKGEELFVDLVGSKPVLRPIEGGVVLFSSFPTPDDLTYYSDSLDEELEVLELLPCDA